MTDQSPQEKFAMARARLAVSEHYLSRDDNPDLDAARQEQLDKNRIPGAFGEEQLSPNSERITRQAVRKAASRGVLANFAQAFRRSVREQPRATLALAALTGFALGALWKS